MDANGNVKCRAYRFSSPIILIPISIGLNYNVQHHYYFWWLKPKLRSKSLPNSSWQQVEIHWLQHFLITAFRCRLFYIRQYQISVMRLLGLNEAVKVLLVWLPSHAHIILNSCHDFWFVVLIFIICIVSPVVYWQYTTTTPRRATGVPRDHDHA